MCVCVRVTVGACTERETCSKIKLENQIKRDTADQKNGRPQERCYNCCYDRRSDTLKIIDRKLESEDF